MRRNILICILLAVSMLLACAHIKHGNKKILEKDYTCYQVKDIRVYFSYTFMFGLFCSGDSIEQAKELSGHFYARIEPLFKYNLINGEMFYQQWAEKKRARFQPVINQSNWPAKGEISIFDELSNYKGRVIKIFRYSEYKYDSLITPNKAEYYICCTPSIDEDGWGAQDLFLIEVTASKNICTYKNWDDVIRHSKVTKFEYLGFEF